MIRPEHESVPESSPMGPVKWMRENLFSSPANSVLTVVSLLVIALFLRSMLAFVLDDSRRWNSVGTNMRLFMTQAYPAKQFIRVWASVGLIVSLIGFSAAAWSSGARIELRRMMSVVRNTTAFLSLVTVLAPGSFAGKVIWLVPLVAIAVAAQWVIRTFGIRLRRTTLPALGVVFTMLSVVVGLLWVVPFGRYLFVAGAPVYEPGTISMSTKLPLTVLLGVLFASYWVGKGLVRLVHSKRWSERVVRGPLLLLWSLSLPIIVLLILRDPEWDFGHLVKVDLVILLAFAIGGGAVIWALSLPRIGELGRVVAGLLVLVAIGSWAIPMLIKIRLLFLLLAAFALGAPTFAGDRRSRIRYVAMWAGLAFILVYFLAAIDTRSTLVLQSKSFLGGLALTFVLALTSITLSFPLGVLMALGRTSSMPIFRIISTSYIELVRGIPFITVLIFFDLIFVLFLPTGLEFNSVVLAIIAGTLFSAAYLAENVRGGLQSIPNGQYEASKAMGLTTLQSTVFIVLPQALRAVIPALVGQTIAIFKDTSLVAIIGLFDFLYIADKVIPNQTFFRGARFENLIFIAAVYWMFTFAFSRASLRLERRVGLGER